MSEAEPTLLEAYTAELRKRDVSEDTIALLSTIASLWIETLRKNPNRLSSSELTSKTMNHIALTFNQHFGPLWDMAIDPDRGFGRMGPQTYPFLIE
jgi:hypothetical protein